MRSHLEMPQGLLISAEAPYDTLELLRGHLGQVIVVHQGPTSTLFAADDVATCRLAIAWAVNAMAEVDLGVLAKR